MPAVLGRLRLKNQLSMGYSLSVPAQSPRRLRVASFWRSPVAITATVLVLPSPCGRTTVPRTIWSAWRVSTPSRIVKSTVSSNLAYLTCFSRPQLHRAADTRASPQPRAPSQYFYWFFPFFPRLPPPLPAPLCGVPLCSPPGNV